MGDLNGFVLVDKPGGWTSHDVVAKVRNLARQKKIGHAGTLDPMATGLLVLGLGRCTRLLRFVQGVAKTYEATACFGVATDSLDADGAVLSRAPMNVTAEEIEAAASRFVGPISQVPPMVSALKIGGRRLYDLARQGEEVERAARAVVIHRLDVTDVTPGDYPQVTFTVTCSTGTYVRSLADDIAAALGGRAHLTALRRVSNGQLSVGHAHGIADLEDLAARDMFAEALLPAADGLPDVPAVTVGPESESAVRNGVAFPRSALGPGLPAEGPVRLLGAEGDLLAVYRVDGGKTRPEVVTAR